MDGVWHQKLKSVSVGIVEYSAWNLGVTALSSFFGKSAQIKKGPLNQGNMASYSRLKKFDLNRRYEPPLFGPDTLNICNYGAT